MICFIHESFFTTFWDKLSPRLIKELELIDELSCCNILKGQCQKCSHGRRSHGFVIADMNCTRSIHPLKAHVGVLCLRLQDNQFSIWTCSKGCGLVLNTECSLVCSCFNVGLDAEQALLNAFPLFNFCYCIPNMLRWSSCKLEHMTHMHLFIFTTDA